MARTDTLSNFLTDIATAIRNKKGTIDTIPASNFDVEIESIESGGGKYKPRYISFYKYTGTELNEELAGLDTSNMTSFKSLFNSCASLQTAPQFDTYNATNCGEMFYGCTSLASVPLYDFSKVKTIYRIFYNCRSLLEAPLFDLSNCEELSQAFYGCSKLVAIPQYNTSKCTVFINAFDNCTNLTTIPELDFGLANNISGLVSTNTKLTTLGGFKDLGKSYSTNWSENSSYGSLNLSKSTSLTYDSLMNVINNLYDIASIGVSPQQLNLGAENLSKLSESDIAIANSKGWNVS